MILPSKSPITLPFNSTDPPYTLDEPHKGVDFAYVPDSTVYAPFTGSVTLVANNGRDGNAVYMTDAEGRLHGLLHADHFLVPNVAKVQEGQPIAVMGQTGYAFGVHLHWCVKENGVFIDPISLIKGEDTMPIIATGEEVDNAFLKYTGGTPGKQQYAFYTQNDHAWLYKDLADYCLNGKNELQATLDAQPHKLEKVTEALYREKE